MLRLGALGAVENPLISRGSAGFFSFPLVSVFFFYLLFIMPGQVGPRVLLCRGYVR